GVDVGDADAVLVGRDPVDLLRRRVDGQPAPGVRGRALDADLHRACRAEAVLAAAHARQAALAVLARLAPDTSQDGPVGGVLQTDRRGPTQVTGWDESLPLGGRARLGGRRAGGVGGAAPPPAAGEEDA